MNSDLIKILGAKLHNLQNINPQFPLQKICLITGPSGSGKSSLVVDTLYQEAQQRYLSTLHPHLQAIAGTFIDTQVDSIEGLRPAICFHADPTPIRNHSTAGTLSGIEKELRLLFASAGTAICPECKKPLITHTRRSIQKFAEELPERTRIQIIAPLSFTTKRNASELQEELLQKGFVRVWYNQQIIDLSRQNLEDFANTWLSILVVSDRLAIQYEKDQIKNLSRLHDSIEHALEYSKGKVIFLTQKYKEASWQENPFSEVPSCSEHNYTQEKLSPGFFSFNQAKSACLQCSGVGYIEEEKEKHLCPTCQGSRFQQHVLNVHFEKQSIADLHKKTMSDLLAFINKIKLASTLEDIRQRLQKTLKILIDLGLAYLSPGRAAFTLSGGELQRLRLGAQLSGELSGLITIFDEPASGLHPEDLKKLLIHLKNLHLMGNSLFLIDHNPLIWDMAEHWTELGPGAGSKGGQLLLNDDKDKVFEDSIAFKERLKYIQQRYQPKNTDSYLILKGATGHNLKGDVLKIPLHALSVVRGVSGSGKSSLILGTLGPALAARLHNTKHKALPFTELKAPSVKHIRLLDQKTLQANQRSTLATLSGLQTPLRELFAKLPAALAQGYKASRFSANIKGGRCESCKGKGYLSSEWSQFTDMQITCPDCQGSGFNENTLKIRYKGYHFADILNFSVEYACSFFRNIPRIYAIVQRLEQVGLGYLSLGTSTKQMSRGEQQRLRLAKELGQEKAEHTLFLLDEPMRGLSYKESAHLLQLFHSFCKKGHSVILIEHHELCNHHADYIVELGPSAGEAGGYITYPTITKN
jgi:excinuclease ABC subunit A